MSREGYYGYYGPLGRDGKAIAGAAANSGDPVKAPSHYQIIDGVEVKDIVRALVPDVSSHYEACAIEYLLRWRKKNGVEDLKKARVYLTWLIEEQEKNNV